MRFGIYAGDTDKTIYVRLRDSTTGLAKTGITYNSAGAVCSYTLPLAARAAIALATQTVTGAHSDGGFVEVDATNCKGLYRLDLPDAAIASGAFTVISIEFDGIIEESVEIELAVPKANVTQWLGTAAATPTVAGVPEVDVTHLLGTAWLTPAVAGTPDVNAKQISGDGTAADNLETMLDGTGGQTLSLGRLVVAYDVGGGAGLAAVSISATNGTSGTGVAIAGVGTSAGMSVSGGATGNGLSVVGGGTSGNGVNVTTTSGHGVNLAPVGTDKHGLFATGGNGGTSDGIKAVAGTGGVPIRGDITGSITGNLSGSVGSVTGAVGSVTGAVGSVTGSVGSVTGAVGSVTGAVGSVTGNVGGNVTGSVGSVATGGISTASFAAGAINAAALAADAGTQIATAVWASATRTLSSFGTLIADIWTSFNATQFAKFFSVDSTTTYASAVAGSVVKEIADNAGGGGGSTTVPQIIGAVTKSGSTYYVTYALIIDGAIVTTGLGTLSVTFYDEDGTDLTFSGTPTAAASGLIYASGTLTTPVTDNRPVMVKVAVTKSAVARSTFLPAVSIA